MKPIRLLPILFCLIAASPACAESAPEQSLLDQVAEADNCVALAYDVEFKQFDAKTVFQDCVERRAILIGMQMRYGVGQYGTIDVIDKMEGYNLLSQSPNPLVQQEANRFSTASGGQ